MESSAHGISTKMAENVRQAVQAVKEFKTIHSVDTGQVFSLEKLSIQRSGYMSASSIDLDCEGRHAPKQ